MYHLCRDNHNVLHSQFICLRFETGEAAAKRKLVCGYRAFSREDKGFVWWCDLCGTFRGTRASPKRVLSSSFNHPPSPLHPRSLWKLVLTVVAVCILLSRLRFARSSRNLCPSRFRVQEQGRPQAG